MDGLANCPVEILEIIFAYIFKEYNDEEERIYELTRARLKQGPITVPDGLTKISSMFERQEQIYTAAFNLSVTCKAFASAMRKSELAWKHIFMLTIGATKWLAKAPYVFETKFKSSFRQMCRFLMTFGLKLGNTESEDIPILKGRHVLMVSKHFIYFLMDEFVHRYDLRTKQWIKLASELKIDLNSLNWFFCSHYYCLLVQEDGISKLKIYDLERDQLIQTYNSPYGHLPPCAKRVIDDKLIFLEHFVGFKCFGLSEHNISTVEEYHRVYYWDRPGSDLIVVAIPQPYSLKFDKGHATINKIVYNRIIDNNTEKNPLTRATISTNAVTDRFKVLGNYKYSKDHPDTNLLPKFAVHPMSFKQEVSGVYIEGSAIGWKHYICGTQLILWTPYPKPKTFVFDLC